MIRRGDLTSPATREIQSGPPTLSFSQYVQGKVRFDPREASPDQSVEYPLHPQRRGLAHKRTGRLPESEAVLVTDRVTADHRDEGVRGQAEHQEDFGDGQPELELSEDTDRPQLESGVRGKAGGDEDGRVQVRGPVRDEDVHRGELEANEGGLGDDVLRVSRVRCRWKRIHSRSSREHVRHSRRGSDR